MAQEGNRLPPLPRGFSWHRLNRVGRLRRLPQLPSPGYQIGRGIGPPRDHPTVTAIGQRPPPPERGPLGTLSAAWDARHDPCYNIRPYSLWDAAPRSSNLAASFASRTGLPPPLDATSFCPLSSLLGRLSLPPPHRLVSFSVRHCHHTKLGRPAFLRTLAAAFLA